MEHELNDINVSPHEVQSPGVIKMLKLMGKSLSRRGKLTGCLDVVEAAHSTRDEKLPFPINLHSNGLFSCRWK